MRIVILGAGTIGRSIAELLCQHGHSTTLVDKNSDHVRRMNEELDVRAICGSASQSSVLFQAGVIGADMCLAVTGVDEVNIVAASMAKEMGARRTMARVYAPVFRDMSTFDYQRHFNIDRLLSLEQLSAMELARGIRNPGSLAVENLARGELEVQEIQVQASGRGVGVQLKELQLPKDIRIGSIVRDDKTWIAGADDTIQADDRITLIGRRDDIEQVKENFRKKRVDKQTITIAGGGETGYHLARTLEGLRFSVVLMETDEDRCEFLANNLKTATVVKADANRHAVLEEERVGNADVFVACTGDDEDNIVACVDARDIGASRIMAIVSRPDYANVVEKLGIDLAVSPRGVVSKQMLGLLNKGAIISRMSLADSDIDVFELEVYEGAPATEHVLANLRLPTHCLIAAVTREDYVRVPGADDRLRPGDTVVALVQRSSVESMLSLFGSNGT